MGTQHRHRHKAKTEVIRGYRGMVRAPRKLEPRAYGGVRYVATCRCGAVRETNANGRFVERGAWVMPEGSDHE